MPKNQTNIKRNKQPQQQQQQPKKKSVPPEIENIINSLDEDSKMSLLTIYSDVFTPFINKITSIEGEGFIHETIKENTKDIKKFHDIPCEEDEKLARVIHATTRLTGVFKGLKPDDKADITNLVNSTSQKNIPMVSLNKTMKDFIMNKLDLIVTDILNTIFEESNKELINGISDYLFSVIEQSYE